MKFLVAIRPGREGKFAVDGSVKGEGESLAAALSSGNNPLLPQQTARVLSDSDQPPPPTPMTTEVAEATC